MTEPTNITEDQLDNGPTDASDHTAVITPAEAIASAVPLDALDLFDDEILPPPELPAEYLDTNRQSLSESDAYNAHLTEHWGF
jgi:hypothetical protein